MVSLLLVWACGAPPPPPPRLPVTRDAHVFAAAIHDLSPDQRVALRPVLERWSWVGWREDVPLDVPGEVILSEVVASDAVFALTGQTAALPHLLGLVDGRQASRAIHAITELDGGCEALAQIASQRLTPFLENAFRKPLGGESDCRPALEAYDTPTARRLKELPDVAP